MKAETRMMVEERIVPMEGWSQPHSIWERVSSSPHKGQGSGVG